ncbi:MAG: hypothetical protein JNM79_21560 [Burkholderiales bacterium]|nr:hypothetical protein [Burkholderiales bacterium]
MKIADISDRARLLLEHRLRGEAIALDANWTAPPDMAVAYAIQRAGETLFTGSHGYRAIGYKIAGTNPAARAHLKIDAPFYGRLYDRMASAAPTVLEARPDFFRVHEAEIALVMARDLAPDQAPFDAATIEAATRAILPAVEIIGTHFNPWTQAGAPNLASDNAAFGHWIFGAAITGWSKLDLMNGEVRLLIDGAPAATGYGRNVDDGPFGACAWLANALVAAGRTLKAGEDVTTGSTTPPVPVAAGQRVVADFGPLGQVEFRIGGA